MRTVKFFTIAAGLLLVPGVAVAAGGGGDVAHTLQDSLVPMAFHALNLALLLGGLGYLLKGPITSALVARADRIARAIDGAGAAEAEAKARFDELSAKMDNFEALLADMRKEADHLAEVDRADLIGRAEREVAATRSVPSAPSVTSRLAQAPLCVLRPPSLPWASLPGRSPRTSTTTTTPDSMASS